MTKAEAYIQMLYGNQVKLPNLSSIFQLDSNRNVVSTNGIISNRWFFTNDATETGWEIVYDKN